MEINIIQIELPLLWLINVNTSFNFNYQID